jgi:hypothetical protein
MPAGNTYEAIASTTLTTTATSVSFSSISGSYTDLVLVVSASVDSAEDLRFRINDDTGSNYSYTSLYGTGSAAGSFRATNQTSGNSDFYGSLSTTLGNSVQILHFLNYSNTTTNKTILSRANRADSGVDANVNLWRSTSAITKITLAKASAFGGTFQSGSTFSLYGIKAA